MMALLGVRKLSRWLSPFTVFAITAGLAAGAGAQAPAPAPQQAPPPMTNLQLYPKDTPRAEVVTTMQGFVAALGQAYAKKNDTANAIKSFEKAVELDPNNQIAKRQLDQLKK